MGMQTTRKLSPDDPDFVDRVREIARRAVSEAIDEHHTAGRPVYYRRNGALVEASPGESETPVDGDRLIDGF